MSAMIATPPRRRQRAVALAAALALVLVTGCGAELGDAATTGNGGGSEGTTGGGEVEDLTIEQLRDLLPAAKDLPDDYRSAPNDDDEDDDETEAAIEEACPDAEALQALMGSDAFDEALDARKKYETADGRGIEFNFTLDPSKLPEDQVDGYIDAINGCEVVEIDDPDQGELQMDLGAEPVEVGDWGLVLTGEVSFEYDGQPIEIGLRSRYFVRNGVGLSVSTTTGLNQDYGRVEADDDVADELAAEVDAEVQELTE